MKFYPFKAIVILLLSISLFSCKKTSTSEAIETNFVKENYDKMETTITMRDGIKLFTVVYSPKDKSKKYPILLQRTPYSCQPYGEDTLKTNIAPNKYLMEEGNIVVYQDVRGRWMSEGTYDNMRA